MSEDRQADGPGPADDRRLAELLESLGPEAGAPRGAEERAWLETLGLLAYGLDPVTPSEGLKRKLMAQVEGERRRPAAPAPPLAETAGRLDSLERRSRRLLPLAATVAFALLGLAGWQSLRISDQRETIDRLASRVEELDRERSDLASARALLLEVSDRLAMVTSPGAEFCLLKPFGESPEAPGARATFVLASDRESWYLSVEGLEPCAAGRIYHLWFAVGDEHVRAATFDGAPSGGRIELSEELAVPPGLRAVIITLETERQAEEPTHPPVLYADQAMQLL